MLEALCLVQLFWGTLGIISVVTLLCIMEALWNNYFGGTFNVHGSIETLCLAQLFWGNCSQYYCLGHSTLLDTMDHSNAIYLLKDVQSTLLDTTEVLSLIHLFFRNDVGTITVGGIICLAELFWWKLWALVTGNGYCWGHYYCWGTICLLSAISWGHCVWHYYCQGHYLFTIIYLTDMCGTNYCHGGLHYSDCSQLFWGS